MNCKNCGNLIGQGERFCTNCGQPVISNVETNSTLLSQNQVDFASGVTTNSLNNQPSVVNTDTALNPVFEQQNHVQNNSAPLQTNMNSTPVNQGFVQQNPVQNNMVPTSNNSVPLQTNMNSTPVNQDFVQQNNQKQSKNKNLLFIVVVIVLVAIILGLIIFLLLTNSGKNKTAQSSNEGNNSSVNVVNNGSTNKNAYKYMDFEFSVPDNYVASEEEGYLMLVNEKDKIIAQSKILEGFTLNDVTLEIEDLKTVLNEAGYTVNSVETKKYNNVDWILFSTNYVMEGTTYNCLVGYVQLGSYHVAQNIIMNVGYLNNDTILNDLSEMYKNATYNGSSQFSSGDTKKEFAPAPFKKIDPSLVKE